MSIKKFDINKVILSVCISIILILLCFYQYSHKINTYYMENAKNDATYTSYVNSKLFEIRAIGIVQSIDMIKDFFFKNTNEITPEIKNQVESKINIYKDKFNIYTYEEFEEFVIQNKTTLDEIKNRDFLVHLDENKEIISEIGIISPIKFDGEIIGGISSKIYQDEFKEVFAKENYKFSTYIFTKSGNVLLGKQNLKNNNVFDFLSELEILEGYSVDDIKAKIKEGEIFNLFFKENGSKNFAFFRPVKGNVCILEIMEEDYAEENIRSSSKFLLITLFQVIIIISIEMIYLFFIISKQNKNMLKIESEKSKEIKGIIDSVPGGVVRILCNDNLEILYANNGFYNLTGYTKDEFIENFKNFYSCIINKEDLANLLTILKTKINLKQDINLEYKIIKKNNETSWISLTGVYLDNKDGLPIYQCIAIDSTSYKKILNDLEVEKEQYRIVSEISEEIIFEYDIKLDTIHISDKYKSKFDIELVSSPFVKNLIENKVLHQDDIKVFFDSVEAVKNGKNASNEIRIKNNHQNYNWVLYQCVPLKNLEGDIYKVIGKISNIDKFKKEIEELKEKSNRDPLTKLYNKAAIENLVNNLIANNKNLDMYLFIIDIDNFKSVNDNFGHIFGDAVLKEITGNIKKVFEKEQFVGRIGGDEFVVFLKDIENEQAIHKKANEICDIFRKTFMRENKDYKISASIGIAKVTKDFNTYTKLLERADIAVYNAKKEGKDRYKIYNQSMNDINLLELTKNKAKDEIDLKKSIYENILMEISEMFLEEKDIKITVNIILATICKNFGVERGYAFEVSEEGKYISNSYEWCEYGIEPFINQNKNIPFDAQEYIKIYDKKPFLYFGDLKSIKNLKEQPFYDYIVQKEGIKSYFTCYIMEQGKIKGYMGLESYNNYFKLTNDEIECAFLVSRFVSSQLLKYEAEQKLLFEDELNQAIISSHQLYTYIIDKNSFKVLYHNEKLKEIIPNIEIGKICYEAKGYLTQCQQCPIKNMDKSEIGTTKFYCELADNWLGATSKKVQWLDKTDAYMICYQDVSQYIEQINYIDSLTGAPNLNKFKIHIKNILNNTQSNYIIADIDIDKFKYINNTFGYNRGDEILKSFALFLNNTLKDNEMFCRVSDDRFLMLLNKEQNKEVYSRILEIYFEIEKMYKDIFKEIKIVFICGIYEILPEDFNIDTIIDKANIARKSIKGAHKNSFAVYTKEMNEQVIKQNKIEEKMRKALENNEFIPYLQPKFNLETKKVCGAEALVRWKEKDGTMIFPNDFIPIFEKNGFIIELDFYIYEMIIKKIKEWLDKGYEPIPISLNVSIIQINNLEFTTKIINLIDKYNVPPEYIEFELTESVFSTNILNLKESMKELKKKGFKLAIDDFGSAYSSLNLLKELNVDIVKLDKGFLYNKDISQENNNSTKEKIIVEYIVKMAKELNLEVICEGVEMESQIKFLKGIGCEIGQGYIFSKPIEIEEFEKKYL